MWGKKKLSRGSDIQGRSQEHSEDSLDYWRMSQKQTNKQNSHQLGKEVEIKGNHPQVGRGSVCHKFYGHTCHKFFSNFLVARAKREAAMAERNRKALLTDQERLTNLPNHSRGLPSPYLGTCQQCARKQRFLVCRVW